MPHATLPSPGFQAFILCGPGASLTTFTHDPVEFPKALVPIGNRPMIWYPLNWCYAMGVTDVTLITPPESERAIGAALSQNPHLTSLPAHKPEILAPEGLTQTTGTAEIFRIPEVLAKIAGNFIVLPCDLVCELEGHSLLEQWMIQRNGLGNGSSSGEQNLAQSKRGALGVYYNTKGEGSIKGEETDFLVTAALPKPIVPPSSDSIRRDIAELVYSVPTSTLKDIIEEKTDVPVRHALVRQHAQTRVLTQYRDAHIYFFPFWVKEYMARNDNFENVSEDVIGWWAKSLWQDGLGDKLGLRDVLNSKSSSANDDNMQSSGMLDDQIDLRSLITTWAPPVSTDQAPSKTFASRVQDPKSPKTPLTQLAPTPLSIPPVHAYIQPTDPALPLIRRVDTAHQLLLISLRLAKLQSAAEAGNDASSFAHATKIHASVTIPQKCRVEADTTLVAENVSISEKCNIKESVIGAGCVIGSGARLQRCLLMDGVEVGENVQLTGCILGRRCKVEGSSKRGDDGTVLKDCQVGDGYVVEWGTNKKEEILMGFGDTGEEFEIEGDDGGEDGMFG